MKKVFDYSKYIFIFGILMLLFALTQLPYVHRHTPIGRYQKAYEFYKMAKKFPKGTTYYNQYMAIARVYFYNQKTFSYETTQMPMPQGMPQPAPQTSSTQSPQ